MERPLASSSISDRELGLPQELEEMRHRGHRGGIINPHRAFLRVHPTLFDGAISGLLVLGFTLAWIRLLPLVGAFWGWVFRLWNRWLGLNADIMMVPQRWAPRVHFSLPFISLSAGGVSTTVWTITAAVTLAIFLSTQLASEEYIGWFYIVRAMVFIQGSALLYFAVAAARFPHDVPTYTIGMLAFGVILIGLVPAVLGLTFYMFDFPAWKKFALTLMIMGYLVLFIPLQYLLQAWLLHRSILFMPALYFIGGPFLDVLIFVCLYSWGMSWQSRPAASYR
jgi:hypothetical protein